MGNNSTMVRVSPETKRLLIKVRDKIKDIDPYAKTDYGSIITRVATYYMYDDAYHEGDVHR